MKKTKSHNSDAAKSGDSLPNRDESRPEKQSQITKHIKIVRPPVQDPDVLEQLKEQ